MYGAEPRQVIADDCCDSCHCAGEENDTPKQENPPTTPPSQVSPSQGSVQLRALAPQLKILEKKSMMKSYLIYKNIISHCFKTNVIDRK